MVPQLNTAVACPFKEAFEGLIGREPWFGLATILGLPPGGGERAERAEFGFGSRAARERAGGAGARNGAGGSICRGLCHVVAFSRRLSANYYGVAAARGASARENAGNGRSARPFGAVAS